MQRMMVGVRFSRNGKVYHFDSSAFTDIKVGDRVIVETARGRQLGEVTQLIEKTSPPTENLKPIERLATPHDLLLHKTWQQKETEALIRCQERVAELKLNGVKIITAEFSLDGSRLSFIISTDSEEKVDLKSLRHDMQKLYLKSQIEIRQVGPRDVAKLLCGMGACGLEKRCCAYFLSEFNPITIKMAKEQGISLTPQEITGMCGRLRCCLIYEFDYYSAARKELPKKNKRVVTPMGEGKVVDVSPLRMTVRVDLPDIGEREFQRDELEPWDEFEILRRKSAPEHERTS